MKENIIVGLDVGSSAVRAVAGQKDLNDREAEMRIVGAAETPSEGVNRGIITSIEEAGLSISRCLEKIEQMTGLPIESVWLGISGAHIISQNSKGIVAVSKIDGEIRETDVERAIEAARVIAVPPNYEILHVIPRSFAINDHRGIKDPIGMSGLKLEVEAQIIQGLSSQIKNLTKSVYGAGIDIEDVVLSVLAAAEAVATNRQKELGVVVINIGSATTSLVVFEEGDVLHTAVLPIGSEHITSDIAIGLRASIDTAEQIKLQYGSALPKNINKKEEIDLKKINSQEDNFVLRRYVAEIIEARSEEIFEKVNQELKKINREGLLPAGAILIGGGSKLEGLIEVAKRKLRLPAALGRPLIRDTLIDKASDLTFSTALGLALWGNEARETEKEGYFKRIIPRFKSVDKARDQIKKWFKTLIP